VQNVFVRINDLKPIRFSPRTRYAASQIASLFYGQANIGKGLPNELSLAIPVSAVAKE
jgi:hypothetical protein